jgi:hypothetical protein
VAPTRKPTDRCAVSLQRSDGSKRDLIHGRGAQGAHQVMASVMRTVWRAGQADDHVGPRRPAKRLPTAGRRKK